MTLVVDNRYSSFDKLAGNNHVHFGPQYDNYITLPIIPSAKEQWPLSYW